MNDIVLMLVKYQGTSSNVTQQKRLTEKTDHDFPFQRQ